MNSQSENNTQQNSAMDKLYGITAKAGAPAHGKIQKTHLGI